MTYPHRVAMISMHTSPLATPGLGDAGGLNVFVFEVARRLGERGLKVDVFTRAESETDPDVVEIHEHTRVINIPAGPLRAVAKEELPGPGAELRRAAGRADAWIRPDPLPLLVVRTRRGAARRSAPAPAGAHHAHDGQGEERRPRRGAAGRARRPGARRGRDRRRRGRAHREHHRRAGRARAALRCPARTDRDRAARSRSAYVPPVRPAEVPGPVRRAAGRAGDLVRRPDPAAQGAGHADPRSGRAGPPRPRPAAAAAVDHHRQPQRAGGGLVPDAAPAGCRARRQRADRLPATLGADRALPLVLRLRRGRGAVLHRVVRPGGAGGPGLRPAGGRDRRRRVAAHGGRRADRAAGGRPGARPVGRCAGRRARLRRGPGPDGSQRRGARVDLQLGQHRRRDPARVRARDRRAPQARHQGRRLGHGECRPVRPDEPSRAGTPSP